MNKQKDFATYTPEGVKLYGHVFADADDKRFCFVNTDRDDHSQFEKDHPDLKFVYTALSPPRDAKRYLEENYK